MKDIAIARRGFLRLAGTVGAAAATTGALGACALSDKADAGLGSGSSKSGGRKVKLGFMTAADAASLFMAKELGYFAERNLDVTLARQIAFASMRDNLLNNEIDGAHSLYSLPLAVAAKVAGSGTTDIKIAMMLSNNHQSITLANTFAGAGYNNRAAVRALLDREPVTIAHTSPGGNHDVFLRYWLRAIKANEKTIQIVTIPPPQMVANMKIGEMAGFSAGEPWAGIGVLKGAGFTHLMTQDLWLHHPEKALLVGTQLAAQQDVLADVMGAILKAARWLDDLDNRPKAIKAISGPAYANMPVKNLESRLMGKVELGAGLGTRTYTKDGMVFFRDGAVAPLRRSHALWFLAQYERFGLVEEPIDYERVTNEVLLRDLCAQVLEKEGIDVPDDDMKPIQIKFDGATFDPTKPQEEVKRP
jgi:nitrate/nitrite transport system substrate-binding protein